MFLTLFKKRKKERKTIEGTYKLFKYFYSDKKKNIIFNVSFVPKARICEK
jgi:hypothetical protein